MRRTSLARRDRSRSSGRLTRGVPGRALRSGADAVQPLALAPRPDVSEQPCLERDLAGRGTVAGQ